MPRFMRSEMVEHNYCTERSEGEEDEAEGRVDEAEEARAEAMGHEANNEGQHGEPGHQAGGGHQDSQFGSFRAEDGMGEREPIGCDTDPVNHCCWVQEGQGDSGGDVCGQMRGDSAFVPAFASTGIGPQGFLDGAEKKVDPQRKQDDHADGREDGLESRIGQVGEEIFTTEEGQGEEDQVSGDRTDSAGEGMAPPADHAAADGQHVDRAHRRCRSQSHEVCARKYVDVGDKHIMTEDW